MVCSDLELSDLDGQLARTYRITLSTVENVESLKAEQRAWLMNQRNRCLNVACVKRSYRNRLAALAVTGNQKAASPSRAVDPGSGAVEGISRVPTRRIQLSSGEVTIESNGDEEKITFRDAKRDVTGETFCNTGDFDAYSNLFAKLKKATIANDRAAIAKLIVYPLRVNRDNGSFVTIQNEGSLIKAYGEVFTSGVLDQIRVGEPANIFCKDGDVMFGGGVVWAHFSRGSEPKIAVVNQ
jgi:uncharacterized protein